MDEKIRSLAEMADFKKAVVNETVNACIEIIKNMPDHCAYTSFQQGIVNCARQQAIDEIKKTFEVDDELVTP